MGNCCGSGTSRSASPSASGYAKRKGVAGLSALASTSRVSAASVPRSKGEILQSANVGGFTFNELRVATRNFRPSSVVGEGGFSSVFKGWIDENTFAPARPGTGMVIAMKKLNQDGFQGHREWLAEVNYLGQLSHPNLVKLVGYYLEDEQRLLSYNAKLSDFGLAKDGPTGDKSHVTTRVMGTYGYAAAEYLATVGRSKVIMKSICLAACARLVTTQALDVRSSKEYCT
ncbi:hypothetical protein GUJ93_ZPchr0001g29470 [Zizania palustris]|uniref:non-specific serine/threonine protein kinase n=1 Tax=Zizania palustris TaxID=103762 RepID=A0A8J5RT26_ZIZPA|nr:hypothetical protein GUJ93_ZPchr0001g29470 [Zizania palustris]